MGARVGFLKLLIPAFFLYLAIDSFGFSPSKSKEGEDQVGGRIVFGVVFILVDIIISSLVIWLKEFTRKKSYLKRSGDKPSRSFQLIS